MKRILQSIIIFIAGVGILMFVFSYKEKEPVVYGVSFSKLHADELRLDWKEVYGAILTDLGVKHLRLSAHWPMIEPKDDEFHFEELDFQMKEAEKHGADVVLAVGRRAPGWPECHDPAWVKDLSIIERQDRQIQYMTEVVNRYKGSPNLKYWQVENEPFLYFAPQYCGTFDESFLQEELALVRELDPTHKVLVTDSGEFGRWYKAKSYGDVFGTSLYLYVWYEHLGFVRYPILPGFFRIKQFVTNMMVGEKETLLIELGSEPWLPQPIAETPIDEQLERMSFDRFKSIVSFASRTGLHAQYLWGAEWWYYMKAHGHPEFWDFASGLYSQE